MELRDRQTLKGYFKKGTLPTEEHFASLIDSVPNIVDDKLSVLTADGRAFYPANDGKLVFTLHNGQGKPAAWTIRLADNGKLAVENSRGEMVIELGQDKSVSLPALNATGAIANAGLPDEGYKEIPADKEWHDLFTVTDNEFQVCDLTLVLYDSNYEHCTETRASVFCLTPEECHLSSPRKHWWGWTGSIKLRLHKHDDITYLQVRSKRWRAYGTIYYKVTKSALHINA